MAESHGDPEEAHDPANASDPFANLEGVWNDDEDAEGGGYQDSVDEGAEEDKAHLQQVIKSIFEYYSIQAVRLKEPRLTSARFMRMALDANLIDARLTTAKVDLAFHRICGSSPYMTHKQFLDGIVRLAATKFPHLEKQEAVMQMYNNHLASFTGPSDGAFSTVPENVLVVIGAARRILQTLYEGYFIAELRPATKRSAGDVLSETQGAFLKVMSDFEVIPDLASKSIVYAVFREVSSTREVPASVKELVLAEGGRNIGRNFTYVHFAVAVGLTAQRCFAEDGVITVVRLFEWMDASKGRTAFLAQFPGMMPSAGLAAFRLMPDSLPEDCEAQIPPDMQRRRRPSMSNSETKAACATGSRKLVVGDGLAGARASSAVGKGALNIGLEGDGLGKIPPPVKQMIQQIFGHYAALGDPLNRSSMSTLKFHRFLRDCGILSSEAAVSASRGQSLAVTPCSAASGRTVVYNSNERSNGQFVPPSRRASERRLTSSGRPSSIPSTARSTASGGGGGGAELRRSSFTVSPSKSPAKIGADLEDTPGLPLRVFLAPPLKQVDADLIFVQAMREAGSSPAILASGRRSSSAGAVGAPQKRATTSSATRRSHMTAEGFTRALADVASRCMPECSSKAQALQDFANKVMEPLSEALLEVHGEDVALAAAFVAEADAQRLFARCRGGLEKVFNHYANENGGCRQHWNSDSISRFAQDFDLIPEVGYLPLMKIMRNCIHFDTCRGRGVNGEMSYSTFEVALVLIAQKMVSVQASAGTLEKVIHLFNRMNSLASASFLSTPLGLAGDVLLNVPKFPLGSAKMSLAASLQVSGSASSSPSGTPARGRHRDLGDMSWSGVMTASP